MSYTESKLFTDIKAAQCKSSGFCVYSLFCLSFMFMYILAINAHIWETDGHLSRR